MNKTTFKAIVGLILTLSFVGMVIMKQDYAFERPTSPQPELGRMIPVLANYNKTVYVTQQKSIGLNLHTSGWLSEGLLVLF
jgi:hypothetical protein